MVCQQENKRELGTRSLLMKRSVKRKDIGPDRSVIRLLVQDRITQRRRGEQGKRKKGDHPPFFLSFPLSLHSSAVKAPTSTINIHWVTIQCHSLQLQASHQHSFPVWNALVITQRETVQPSWLQRWIWADLSNCGLGDTHQSNAVSYCTFYLCFLAWEACLFLL
jgi:hypothetical protein